MVGLFGIKTNLLTKLNYLANLLCILPVHTNNTRLYFISTNKSLFHKFQWLNIIQNLSIHAFETINLFSIADHSHHTDIYHHAPRFKKNNSKNKLTLFNKGLYIEYAPTFENHGKWLYVVLIRLEIWKSWNRTI